MTGDEALTAERLAEIICKWTDKTRVKHTGDEYEHGYAFAYEEAIDDLSPLLAAASALSEPEQPGRCPTCEGPIRETVVDAALRNLVARGYRLIAPDGRDVSDAVPLPEQPRGRPARPPHVVGRFRKREER